MHVCTRSIALVAQYISALQLPDDVFVLIMASRSSTWTPVPSLALGSYFRVLQCERGPVRVQLCGQRRPLARGVVRAGLNNQKRSAL